MATEEVLQAIYFTGPFGEPGSALRSAVPVVALLALYRIFSLGRRDRRRILLYFILGWLGRTVTDFLTHVDDVRPPFWTLSDWTWFSPVSYYNGAHYGRQFFIVNHGLMLLTMVLLVARLRQRKTGAK